MQARGSGKASWPVRRERNGQESISCLETTVNEDPRWRRTRHELEPQEFQVNVNGDQTRLRSSPETSSRLLCTTDLEAVAL